ncbi:glycine cleavage system aminomethyltransferase GcvT [Paracoccaceae bacterium GXU_MW_L88]
MTSTSGDLRRTPLYDLHVELGGKMVPFAGYEMPVQYPLGVMKEHLHSREKAGLFDVSHMGQIRLTHPDGVEAAAKALETLVPVDVLGLKEGRQRYALFTNENGGIEDDLMVARRADHLFLVVNAACKDADFERASGLAECDAEMLDRALVALQGPAAATALARLAPEVAEMTFMDVRDVDVDGAACIVSRSGYTGEDGFEISIPLDHAESIARKLIEMDEVEPIGLGARDSLRLEAGMCLYGHDLTPETTPVSAALPWAIQKIRRSGGAREGGFPGAGIILPEFDNAPAEKRVGLKPEGRAPMREGVTLYADDQGQTPIGQITSGGFGPSMGHPVAMGYVEAGHAAPGTTIYGEVRGKFLPVTVADLPFHTPDYKR